MLKVGSVVVLKSGGPVMTVAAIYESLNGPKVDCFWHDFKGRFDSGTFHPDMLTEEILEQADEVELDVGGLMRAHNGRA